MGAHGLQHSAKQFDSYGGGRGERSPPIHTHTAYNRHALDRKSEKERARTKRRARKWNRKKKKRNTKERRER